MKPRKVFCLGFQKTGTSSVGLALKKLGYSVASYYPFRDLASKDTLTWDEVTDRALSIAESYDAAKDTPWPLLYRELDAAFPNARFILITRNRDAWINSAVKDFAHHPNAIHNLIYDCPYPVGHEDTWLARYDRHNAEVKAYFANRPDDFISLDMNQGEVNWDNLCRFLDEPDPGIAWPHANTHRTKRLKMKYYKMKRWLGLEG
ncbi:hypothetical protein BXY70_1303 [Roseovarius halotolerans]|mgnify:CR=1 FL=1|uniref:Sulfotransferase family protein n=1 Tax=Roseovarius halotolerans TaxID=505353 RepID=A0A1X6Y5X4_9RHOB|nr:sulfotransferase family protein [Roseovarius halotolerans]RKT35272.1 hypothetical protein BXY70_1303 [Roseovarius halotolerans]SLN11339.1 hypothetical protein ROH8110_00091 [Roseovarius halotolerans]